MNNSFLISTQMDGWMERHGIGLIASTGVTEHQNTQNFFALFLFFMFRFYLAWVFTTLKPAGGEASLGARHRVFPTKSWDATERRDRYQLACSFSFFIILGSAPLSSESICASSHTTAC